MKKDAYGTYDIEANDWIYFIILGFFDGQTYRTFDTIQKFLKHLDQRMFDGFTIYGHNAGKYDLLFLLSHIYDMGWNPFIMVRGAKIILCEVETSKGYKIKFTDSTVILPGSLENLSEAFDVGRKKIPMNFDIHHTKSDKKLLRHLENDCVGLHQVIAKFRASDFVISPKLTIASQAMDTFTKRFLPSTIETCSIEHEDAFRKYFYSGGRVEVYKGSGRINVYDVNSLYPSVMLQEMPSGECVSTKIFHPDKIGFYEVEVVNTPKFYIPPYLIKKGTRSTTDNVEYETDKNYFVNGSGKYYLSSAMILWLKSNFGIRFKINWGFYFRHKEYLFNDYVEHFYDVKQKSDPDGSMYYLAKLFLNSLYGKFGQKREAESIQPYSGQPFFRPFEGSPLADKLGLVLVPTFSKSKFICVYLAAYITELARLHHFTLMQQREDSIFYCDTDSIFTSGQYPTGPGIGELSFKGQFEGVFLQAKTYALKAKGIEDVKFKGFTADKFSFRQFKEHLKSGKPLTEEREVMLSYKMILRRTDGIIRTADTFLKMVKMKKTASMKMDKRKVLPSKDFIFDTQAFTRRELGK